MSSVDCTPSIPNPSGEEALPFWPATRRRLILIFEALDGSDSEDRNIVVHGLDPDKHGVAFWAQLRLDQKEAFVAAVARGAPVPEEVPSRPSNENISSSSTGSQPAAAKVDHDTVVIGDNGGDGPGPKLTYKLTLVSSEPDTALASGLR